MNKYLQWIHLDKSILKKFTPLQVFLLSSLQRVKCRHQVAVIWNMAGA